MSGSFVGQGLLCVAVASALGVGCSFLTSSSGLSGGRADAGDDGAALGDDAALMNDSATDTGADAGDDGLVGHWAFEETNGGIAHDSSGKGNDATLSGAAVFTASCGQSGGCLRLSPSGNGIQVTALDGAAFPRSGTFSIWFRWNTMVQADEQSLLDTWDDKRNHLCLRHAPDEPIGAIQAHIESSTFQSGYVWVTGFSTTANRWTHAVLTWNEAAREAILFVDGALIHREPYAAYFVPSDQRFRIGAGFDGQIDEVRLYDRALSPDEAAAVP